MKTIVINEKPAKETKDINAGINAICAYLLLEKELTDLSLWRQISSAALQFVNNPVTPIAGNYTNSAHFDVISSAFCGRV